MRQCVTIGLLTVIAGLVSARSVSAELVFLTTGRHLTVKEHRVDGTSVVLVLRSGGEIVCEQSLIARIEPDEVPYPEPSAAPVAVASEPSSLPSVSRYADIIESLSAEQGVNPRLVKAVVQIESNYQERARSPKGAMGLMQLMPQTAQQYAVSDPYDARSNLEAGIRHLKFLLQRFDVRLALAAYNAGEAAVRKFGGIPPYPETQAYVIRVLKLAGLMGRSGV